MADDPRKDPEYAAQLRDFLLANPSYITSREGIRSFDEWPAQRTKLLAELQAVIDG